MAFTTPKTYVVGAILPAADLNTYERDNIRYLKGLDGEIVLSDYLDFPSTAQGDVFYHDGTKLARLAVGTSGQFLKTQGAAANPLWADGQDSRIKIVRKSADEIVNNSTTYQNDDHLLFAIAASEVWLAECFILYYCATNTVGIKFQFTAPAAATINRIIGYGYNTSEALAVMSAATELSFGEWNVNMAAHFWLIVANSTNAGNVQLQWAQAVAEVNDTKVIANSCIIAHKLA